MNVLGYAVREALVSLRRSLRSAAMSIGTIAIAFLTLGGFLLLSANLEAVVARWAEAAEMSIYLRDGVTAEEREALVADVQAHDAVVGVEYISREIALDRFKQDFPELVDVAESTGNPFPPSLEVRLRADARSSEAAEALAASLGERAGVVDVRYERQWLSRLLGIVTTIRLGGVLVAGVLVLGAAFTVAAVVRLSLEARREEVEIMQLVGAPFSFIRGPSMMEGMLLGAIGAAVSLVLLAGLFAAMRGPLAAAANEWGSVGELRFLGLTECLLLVLAGVVVGGLAGMMASRAAR